MRNLLLLVLPVLFACGPTSADVSKLKAEAESLQTSIELTRNRLSAIEQQVAKEQAKKEGVVEARRKAEKDVEFLSAQIAGKKIRYILKVTLKQTHFSLNPLTHVKDSMNSETFELFTDKDSYDKATPGEDLFSSFRTGSAFLYGSWGNWKIRIDDKRMLVE